MITFMAPSDEETGTGTNDSEAQSNKKYVANVYETIACVFMSIIGIAVAGFLLFCIGWTIWQATPWIFPMLGLIVVFEVAIWNISLWAGRNNRKENWDDGIACQMLWFGFLYLILVLLEGTVIGVIGYLIFVESPYWIQVVAYVTLGGTLTINVIIHMFVHWANIYAQDSQCIPR